MEKEGPLADKPNTKGVWDTPPKLEFEVKWVTHTRYSLGKWEFATKSRMWVIVLKTAWKQQW